MEVAVVVPHLRIQRSLHVYHGTHDVLNLWKWFFSFIYGFFSWGTEQGRLEEIVDVYSGDTSVGTPGIMTKVIVGFVSPLQMRSLCQKELLSIASE